jgi:hypothetical protein
MAVTVEQDTKSTQGLGQTLTITYSSGPTEGNLLLAWAWHDETGDNVSMSSSGWTEMATTTASLGGFTYRITLWAKWAGASESTTISIDLGETNRRAHGYGVELSGHGVTELPAALGATFVSGDNGGSTGTSNQVDDAIEIQSGQIGVALCGLNGTSASAPTWASEITMNENWSNNFRASGIGYTENGAGSIQPTSTWGTSRHNLQMVVALGVPPAVSKVLAGSTMRALKVA